MGCCYSDENSDANQDSDVNETTHLLHDPVSVRPVGPVPSYTASATSQPKGDEQSALNRILHHTANNVIDVGALDAHHMEQHEYMDRARIYSVRLSKAVGGMRSIPTACSRQFPTVGVAAPQAILSQPPLSQADIMAISTASEQIAETVKEIRVKHKVDLVVPFGLS